MESKHLLRQKILELVSAYHVKAFAQAPFVAGQAPVPVSGRVFDARELVSLTEAVLDFWLTSGRFADDFERGLEAVTGVRHAVLCNSGSSANLLAVSALCSPVLGERRLVPGDEVITVAAGFPTTVAPIIQNGLVPVFIDIDSETLNVRPDLVEAAVGPRTRAVVIAHTLGNPFDFDAVAKVAERHRLWLIEDACDALGATSRGRAVGSLGELATLSFYPAHHITTGEGGAVLTNDGQLKRVVESLRDWGRDCWCAPGKDNTCGRRFNWQLGSLPPGYDHKYTYSHLGYNLKMTDLQAAVGIAQLDKLPGFITARRRNWQRLAEGLHPLEEYLVMQRATPNSEPSWFGFAITVAPAAPFTRAELIAYLDARRIATRLLFGGNLLRQPAFGGVTHRVAGELLATDTVMERTLWLGVFPGLTSEMLDFVVDSVYDFVHRRQGR